jgi:hypothetical protein
MGKRVVIEGSLVDYPSGGKSGRSVKWSVGFHLAPWRANGGPWDDRHLLVDLTMTDRELKAAVARWRRGSAVRIAATPPAATKARGPEIRMLARGVLPVRRFAGKIPAVGAAEPSPPRSVSHPKLGRLRYDVSIGYSAWRKVGTERYEASIAPRDANNAEKLARDIDRGAGSIVGVERKLGSWKAAAAKKLLPLHQKSWRGEEPRLSAVAFAKRLTLASVMVDTSGRTSVIFEAGDLFGDHGIELGIGTKGQLTRVDLA